MSPQAAWLLQEEVVPRLQASIPRNVPRVGCEDAQELIQDATLMAAKLMHNVQARGKAVTPGNIAYYTMQLLRSGRRSTGSSCVDVMASLTQLEGHTRLSSLEEPASLQAEGESFTLGEVLSNDQEDPSQIAARHLDWQTLRQRLTEQEQAIVDHLLAGRSVSEVAWGFKVSRSAMQQCKERLGQQIKEFMGLDILFEVLRAPGWKHNLNTTRQKRACRYERRN